MVRQFRVAASKRRISLAARALAGWSPRQYLVAALVAAAFALLVGVATVLIPNPWFARDIATVWWNYPVWLLTAVGAGMLTATYVSPAGARSTAGSQGSGESDRAERRTSRMGIAGGVLTWFAVGCPVCNKIALLALGYSGAITWFAPLQPVLAVAALGLTGVALVWRLSGQIACPLPPSGGGAAVSAAVPGNTHGQPGAAAAPAAAAPAAAAVVSETESAT